MRLRHIPQAATEIVKNPLVITEQAAAAYKGKWQSAFHKENPLHLEIGMGRGRFIFASAAADPNVNFLALEIRPEMVFQAIERADAANNIDNLRLLWCDAARLTDIFAQGELSCIYLNFPDPWPKKRHSKRRLTAGSFLRDYQQIMAVDGKLLFKTDNRQLFDWSLTSFEQEKWQIDRISYDLPLVESAIITEYEGRYRRHGQPIYFAAASPFRL